MSSLCRRSTLSSHLVPNWWSITCMMISGNFGCRPTWFTHFNPLTKDFSWPSEDGPTTFIEQSAKKLSRRPILIKNKFKVRDWAGSIKYFWTRDSRPHLSTGKGMPHFWFKSASRKSSVIKWKFKTLTPLREIKYSDSRKACSWCRIERHYKSTQWCPKLKAEWR